MILAGISINTVLGDNGILHKAKNVKLKTGIEREKEILNLSISSTKISDDGNILEVNKDKLKEEIEKKYGSNVDIDESTDTVTVVFTNTNRKYEINKVNNNIELIDNNVEIVNTQEKTLKKESNDKTNSTGNEKLELIEEMQGGGIWKSSNSDIVSVDNSGNIEWKSIGKAKVTYTVNSKMEVFNINCEYVIVPETDGWNVSHDCGTYNDSVIWGNSSKLDILNENVNGKPQIIACAMDNRNTYHVTIWRTVDLTNVNSIEYEGYYCSDAYTNVSEGYKSGIVETSLNNGVLDANCTYKEEYSEIQDVQSKRSTYIEINHNVSELQGEHILAFTATHANITGYTNKVGYRGNILLKP